MRESAFGTDRSIQEEIELLRSAERGLRNRGIEQADIAVVLGSGLKDFAAGLEEAIELPLHSIQEFPKVRVRGQGGMLVQGWLGETLVHCLTGRVHLYEGYHPWEVVRAVHSLAMLGTPNFFLTNAAGGIREDLMPGSLMLLTDHLNLAATNPLVGSHNESLGPRFPALNEVYDPRGRKVLRSCDPGHGLREGVYAQLLGPSYETPAEIRMVRTLGGDAVGMSTVPEAIALHAMGCRVFGLSVITNRAAGLSVEAPSHQEVLDETIRAAERFEVLLNRAIPELAMIRDPVKKTRAKRTKAKGPKKASRKTPQKASQKTPPKGSAKDGGKRSKR